MKTLLNTILISAALFSVATPIAAVAQDAVSLEGEVQVERTVIKNGTTTTFLEEPASVVPGDRLLFTTIYRHQGAETVEDFVVTNPLPSAIALAENDGDFLVSVDNGETFGALTELSVVDETSQARAARLGDVTHVRWVLAQLDPGASGSLSYYATVR